MPPPPIVALANWYQFMPAEQVANPRVESRMLLWCRSGAGQVWVDDHERPLPPGSFLLLPWAHGIRYRAARHQPFLLGGVHLIPQFSGAEPLGVAHSAGHLLHGAEGRRDDPALPGHVISGKLDDHPGLGPLADHLAQTWAQCAPIASLARAQGELVLAAIHRVLAAPDASELPGELIRLRSAVLRRLERDWHLAVMASAAGCSTAWLARLARRHWRTSPCRWLHQQRLEQARTLLTTSDRPVTDIANAVGIVNRHRFSRSFHSAYGASPRTWRNRHRGP